MKKRVEVEKYNVGFRACSLAPDLGLGFQHSIFGSGLGSHFAAGAEGHQPDLVDCYDAAHD